MAEKRSSPLINFLWHNSAVVGITMSTTLMFGFATLYLHDFINVSNFMVGVAASLSHVISVILSPLAGTLSDNTWTRWGRRRPYIMLGAVLAALCVAAMPHTLNYWVFLLLVSLFFTFSVAYQIPFYALIPEMAGEGRRGAYSTFTGLLRLLGAGLVLGLGGAFWAKNPAWLFYVTAFVIVFTAAITFISVREDGGGKLPDQDKISIFRNFRRYMRDLISQKKILIFFAAQFFWWLGLGSLMPFATIMLEELYGVRMSELFRFGPGVVVGAALLIGAIVAAGVLGDKWGHRQIVTVGLVSLTIGSVIAFFARDLLMLYVAAPFIVVGAAPLFNEPFALLAELVPKGREGEFYGLDTISITLSQVPASLLGGAVIDAFGYTSVYLLVTSTSLIAILLMWLKSRV